MSVLGGYLNGTVTGSYCHRRLVVTTNGTDNGTTMECYYGLARSVSRTVIDCTSHWYLRLGDNRIQAPCTHEGRHDLG